MAHTTYVIRRRTDAQGWEYYTHGWPGHWRAFPTCHFYPTKGAATRQANRLPGSEVVPALVELVEPSF